MWRKCLKIAALVTLVLLPVAAHAVYKAITAYPERITIAVGPSGGQYLPLGEALEKEIEERLNVDVRLLKTQGSLENLQLLARGEVDFALYQPGTAEILEPPDDDPTAHRLSDTQRAVSREDR